MIIIETAMSSSDTPPPNIPALPIVCAPVPASIPDHTVTLREIEFTKEELADVRAAATKDGVSLDEFITLAVRRGIAEHKTKKLFSARH